MPFVFSYPLIAECSGKRFASKLQASEKREQSDDGSSRVRAARA